MYAPVLPGKILEINDRTFLIDTLHYDDDGAIGAITAKCLDPHEDDTSLWWAIEVLNEALLQVFTLH